MNINVISQSLHETYYRKNEAFHPTTRCTISLAHFFENTPHYSREQLV
jgi:hypothetical protein